MINRKRIVDEFLHLVCIDSESLNEKEIADYLAKKLKELGLDVWVDNGGETFKGNTGNVIGRLSGNVKGEPLLFIAHMDTVKPGNGVKPIVEKGVIKSDGNTVLGSDDKSGIVAILEILRILKEDNIPHPEIEILFTFAEEIGLYGAKTVDTNRLHSKCGFALDSESIEKIIIKAPFQNSIKINIYGVESHAGVVPERGISAIKVAAEAINSMKLGRIDSETTANVGVIEGGKAANIVAGHVKLICEARSHNVNKLEKQTKHMINAVNNAVRNSEININKKKLMAKSNETVIREFDGISVGKDEFPAILAYKAIEKAGLKPRFEQSGGGSDANILNGKGIKTVILGTGMSNVHTKEEFIKVKNLIEIAEIVENIIRLSYE